MSRGGTAGRGDVVVIGAGVNGLTCATLLAKGGARVTLLERRDVVGGLLAEEEFHPGYRAPGMHHETGGFRDEVFDALDLGKHGVERVAGPATVFYPEEDGPGLLISEDPEAAAAEIRGTSAADAEAYRAYRAFFGKVAALADHLFRQGPPDLNRLDLGALLGPGLAFRRMGSKEMMELLRMGPMCVADWLNEHFETERLKAGLAVPAVLGSFAGPWSPGTQTNLMLHEANRGRPIRGGGAALIAGLESAARAAGVEIRTGAAVERIILEDGRVSAVALTGGGEIPAQTVAASCDPKTTLLKLLAPRDLPSRLEHRMEAYRANGTTAKVNLALSAPLRYAGRTEFIERAFTGETLDNLERAFDSVKYGEFSERPVLDVLARDGDKPVASIVVHYAPYDLRRGWSEETRNELGDRVVAELARVAPDVSGNIVAREILTPADVEARYGTDGGHIYHGEHGIDQLAVRPAPDCARHATPIAGLFLCGSGSYPGGGVTGAPGALAARAARG